MDRYIILRGAVNVIHYACNNYYYQIDRQLYGRRVDTQTLLGVGMSARRWAKPVCVSRRV